jgi:hypothetical protein
MHHFRILRLLLSAIGMMTCWDTQVLLLPPAVDAFLTGVGIVFFCTICADGWRIVARPTPPTAADWACGPDLIVAGIALTISSLPYMGAEAGLLWTLVGGMFGVLIAITGVTRQGYVGGIRGVAAEAQHRCVDQRRRRRCADSGLVQQLL